MTEQDKNEIRMIIREELTLHFGNTAVASTTGLPIGTVPLSITFSQCVHEWETTHGTMPYQRCKKCFSTRLAQ